MTKADRNDESIHVVTENGEQSFLWCNRQLTYIGQDKAELPAVLGAKFGQSAQRLDLSYNSLTSLNEINKFVNLVELVIDNNSLGDDVQFMPNSKLKLLSINKNRFTDCEQLITQLSQCFPQLEFLSLIGNPVCPDTINLHQRLTSFNDNHTYDLELNSNDEHAYKRFRLYIICHFEHLKFLNSTRVTPQERQEAHEKACYLKIVRPTLDNCYDKLGHINGTSQASAINSKHVVVMGNGTHDELPKPRGVFSRLAYRYTGKNSEGNRFIRNADL